MDVHQDRVRNAGVKAPGGFLKDAQAARVVEDLKELACDSSTEHVITLFIEIDEISSL